MHARSAVLIGGLLARSIGLAAGIGLGLIGAALLFAM
jgi:hypothetical protein